MKRTMLTHYPWYRNSIHLNQSIVFLFITLPAVLTDLYLEQLTDQRKGNTNRSERVTQKVNASRDGCDKRIAEGRKCYLCANVSVLLVSFEL